MSTQPPHTPTPSAVIDTDVATDLSRVRRFLVQDPFATAYMLGDLDPVYQPYNTWYLAHEGGGGRDIAIVQVYTGLSAPVLIGFGAAQGLAAIVARHFHALPGSAHIHLMPEHLAILDRAFHLERLRPMVRMALTAGAFVPAPTGDNGEPYGPVERLGHRDTGEIMQLFTHYPDSFFEPHQLSSGHYFGIRPGGGPLIAVAGVHVVSRHEGIAALGNIVTHPDHRGRGLSTRLTSHLVSSLIADGIELLALNVERKNHSALKVYEKLGFREHCTYLEGFATRSLSATPASSGDEGRGAA
jgi:GNAT superfamily N-acetyltransferase